ncbi:hypothetical protein LCGC14_2403910, partial [marine sediment metagenome]
MNTKLSRPGRVLIVDDEPDICEALTLALAAEGLAVTSAGSGAEARESARNDRPDLLVTDMMLPDCTGLELIRTLRDDFAELPVVIITGFGDAATFSEASKTHPVELLNKP